MDPADIRPVELPVKNPAWSRTDVSKAIALRRSGASWDEVSKKVPGRTSKACYLRCRRHLKRWEQNEEGEKTSGLYNRYGFKRVSDTIQDS